MSTEKTVNDISELQLGTHQTYKQHPILNRLMAKLENIENFSFFDFSTDFESLVSSDFFDFVIAKEIDAFKQEEYYQLPLYHGNDRVKGWSILNTPYFRLTTFSFNKIGVSLHRENKSKDQFSLKINPQDALLYFAKAEGTILDIYEITTELDLQSASPCIALKSSLTLRDGDVVKLKAGMHAIHFREVNEDMIYHEVSGLDSQVKVIGEYNLSSLKLVGVSAANLASSRAEMFAEMVANLNHKASIPVLEKLGAHTDHFVRWSAAMNLYALDQDAGIHLIQKLTQDPHPDVKATAQRCCEMFAEQH
ncbi:hypothetical protein D210916BOD24_34600 [Alteromonas sp. D210916BOD_24]|uniref:HEAT repeat domain-containing protein n=1 Tax=Alteromonas sp. D210916BOD_24 TaxID=3157618 RepID=UPI00399CED63